MIRSIRNFSTALMLSLLCCLSVAGVAHANRALQSTAVLNTDFCARCPASPPPKPPYENPPFEGQIEGPCGLLATAEGTLYVADFYHRVIDLFTEPLYEYESQIALPGHNPTFGTNTLDSVCAMALDAQGNLYGNEWHQGAVRITPSYEAIDSGDSTGIAVDPTSNRLFVDDRTYIAEYELPATAASVPLRTFAVDSGADYFGLAVFESRLYVADAADQTVKVFQPDLPATAPVATISGGFISLHDASLAIDPTNGHLLVVDNTQPGFAHPKAAIYEFGSPAQNYVPFGKLSGSPIFGAPSGIAVTEDGSLYVTDGNDELSNAFLYGPYQEGFAAIQENAGQEAPATANAVSSAAIVLSSRQPPADLSTAGSAQGRRKTTHRRHRKHHPRKKSSTKGSAGERKPQ